MRNTKTLSIALGLAIGASAQAANLIVYDFESEAAGALADTASIANSGTSGANGTVGGTAGGTATIVTGAGPGGLTTNYLSLAPSDDGLEGIGAPHIGTGGTIDSLNVGGDKAYTFAAWVRYNNDIGDNMVFGSNAGNVLHLGSRNSDGAGQHWSGHWGDDLNSNSNPTTDVGEWHHVAWTNTDGGLQSIYVDGAFAVSGGDGNFGAYGGNGVEALLVGTSRNGGSFNGDLDDVRVYDEVLSAAQIEALATVAIPEPTSGILLSLASLALLRRRR
ncbi:MAG: LamG domain-containing protein [Akkermansiaceae bacterium]|nr:LamG domain-containing protein [Akkermansiaceae bacterium]